MSFEQLTMDFAGETPASVDDPLNQPHTVGMEVNGDLWWDQVCPTEQAACWLRRDTIHDDPSVGWEPEPRPNGWFGLKTLPGGAAVYVVTVTPGRGRD